MPPYAAALTLPASAASFAAVERVSDIFSQVANAPAAQALLRRVESGDPLSLDGISVAAQPFLIALLGNKFPQRTIIAITAGLKAQENFHQDLTTWANVQSSKSKAQSSASSAPLFFPAWDILPHEAKLPHVDVISERLETLVSLAGESKTQSKRPKFVVANIVALMQRTFPAGAIAERTRELKRGDQINPLDLVEWLEDQGYEPEAQVSGKGEIALRGGILDIFPPTRPWPVRVEFFGDEIDSIREFDPVSQLSKDAIERVMISPAGELGILKRAMADTSQPSVQQLSTLLDYLPSDALIVVCEPEAVNQAATDYAVQVPTGDPFFVSWEELRQEASSRSLTWIELTENAESMAERATEASLQLPQQHHGSSNHDTEGLSLQLPSLDAFRPITERAADIQVAEAQRREFFTQLHRWLRQGFAVYVFCNTDGERQRFGEICK
jgi:transcription-repair coupling factor (superfamily II helicase)